MTSPSIWDCAWSSADLADELPWVTAPMAVSTLEVISVSFGSDGMVFDVSTCCFQIFRSGSVASLPVFQAARAAGRSLVRVNQSAWPAGSVRYLMKSFAAALCWLSAEIARLEPPAIDTEPLVSAGSGAMAHFPLRSR